MLWEGRGDLAGEITRSAPRQEADCNNCSVDFRDLELRVPMSREGHGGASASRATLECAQSQALETHGFPFIQRPPRSEEGEGKAASDGETQTMVTRKERFQARDPKVPRWQDLA